MAPAKLLWRSFCHYIQRSLDRHNAGFLPFHDVRNKGEVKRVARYSDEEIRNMPRITIKIAADYLGISASMLTLGMRNDLLPIGFAVHNEDRYRDSWTYTIVPERLIAYNHGKINEIQVQNIEKNPSTIISQFEEVKRDLVFLLSEKEEWEG